MGPVPVVHCLPNEHIIASDGSSIRPLPTNVALEGIGSIFQSTATAAATLGGTGLRCSSSRGPLLMCAFRTMRQLLLDDEMLCTHLYALTSTHVRWPSPVRPLMHGAVWF